LIRLIARRKANIKILRQRHKALRGSQPKLSEMNACEEEMSAAVKQRKTKTSKKSKKESETESSVACRILLSLSHLEPSIFHQV